jgi:hypothetical protein
LSKDNNRLSNEGTGEDDKSTIRFVRKEHPDGSLDGFEMRGFIFAGEELPVAEVLEDASKVLRLRVENDKRSAPLSRDEVEKMAFLVVELERVIRNFIEMDLDEAKEVLELMKSHVTTIRSGR